MSTRVKRCESGKERKVEVVRGGTIERFWRPFLVKLGVRVNTGARKGLPWIESATITSVKWCECRKERKVEVMRGGIIERS